MYKNFTAILLALALLFSLTVTAGASGAIRDLTATALDATSIGLTWTTADPDGPLFTITCRAQGAQRITERRTYHTDCTINYLSPNTTYEITVTTKAGASASVAVTMPSPTPYTDFNYQLLDTGVYKSIAYDDFHTAAPTLDGAALYASLSGYDYSFLMHFRLSATRQNKYLDFELVLRLPNDDVYTLSDVLWYAADRTAVTEYYVINPALKRIYKDYGAFPAGVYTLTAYIDNAVAAETTFSVE